jgi:RHS repeat-associated protein
MVARSYVSNNTYRYGYQGKELDNDGIASGDYDFGARIYDPRTGRFLSLDPLSRNYASMSPYSFAGNRPIQAIDYDGKHPLLLFGFVGALLGGTIEIGAQIMEGLFTGKNFKESFKAIDWADVLHASLSTGLDAMTLGLSKVLTGSTHALLDAEFDLKFFDEDGNKLGKGKKLTYGFGKDGHKKEQGEVLKDVILGGVGVLIDVKANLGDKMSAYLDEHGLKGLKKTLGSSLIVTLNEVDHEFPLADFIVGGAMAGHESYLMTREDKGYDLLKDKVNDKVKQLKIKHSNNKWQRDFKKGKNYIGKPRFMA